MLPQLLIKYPKNVQVLRSYAVFLDEIRNDIEYSQLAFRTAEELEEERSRKQKKKSKKFAKKVR